jgi:hypothetical protein
VGVASAGQRVDYFFPAPERVALAPFSCLAKILWGDGQLSIGRLGSGHLDQEAPHGICRDARITC